MRWILLFCFCSILQADELVLPFSDEHTPVITGWLKADGSVHGGIDYGCDCGTPLLAARDGYAIAWSEPHLGTYILQYHPGTRDYTLYAHLKSVAADIPYLPAKRFVWNTGWQWIRRYHTIGQSGKSGSRRCKLHLGVSLNGLEDGRIDPYGLYGTADAYPGCEQSARPDYLFADCPPMPYTHLNCVYPGPFTEIMGGGDSNGDGMRDMVRFYPAMGKWETARSTGQAFLPWYWSICIHGINSDFQAISDFDGDGYEDAFAFYRDTGLGYVARGRADGKFSPDFSTNAQSVAAQHDQYWLKDVDGDNRADLIGYIAGWWRVAQSTGTTLQSEHNAIIGFGQGSNQRLVGDVNGDGLFDALAFTSGTGAWEVALGQTDATFKREPAPWALGFGNSSDAQYVADVTGDGRADAIGFWHNYVGTGEMIITVWKSTGTRFAPTPGHWARNMGARASVRMFADVDGDALADYVFYQSGIGWFVARSNGSSFLPATLWLDD